MSAKTSDVNHFDPTKKLGFFKPLDTKASKINFENPYVDIDLLNTNFNQKIDKLWDVFNRYQHELTYAHFNVESYRGYFNLLETNIKVVPVLFEESFLKELKKASETAMAHFQKFKTLSGKIDKDFADTIESLKTQIQQTEKRKQNSETCEEQKKQLEYFSNLHSLLKSTDLIYSSRLTSTQTHYTNLTKAIDLRIKNIQEAIKKEENSKSSKPSLLSLEYWMSEKTKLETTPASEELKETEAQKEEKTKANSEVKRTEGKEAEKKEEDTVPATPEINPMNPSKDSKKKD